MEGLDYWRLCDEVSVIQAALLIIGRDPSELQDYIDNTTAQNRPDGYDAVKTAIVHAILGKRLSATIRRRAWERGWNEEPSEQEKYTSSPSAFKDDDPWPEEARTLKTRGVIYRADPDWYLTTVTVENLQNWLWARGVKNGFFFPAGTDTPDYLDPTQPYYSPKLSAAVAAWQAITANPSLRGGGSIKQALTKWLRLHAGKFALTKEDGKPNEQGIQEVAKVANWDTAGGAPKTPTGANPTTPT